MTNNGPQDAWQGPDPDPSDRIGFNLQEVADLIGVGKSSIEREVAEGRLRSTKVRGRRIVLRDQLDAYVSKLDVESMGRKPGRPSSKSSAVVKRRLHHKGGAK